MSLKSKRHLIGCHPAPVIGHFDAAEPTIDEPYRDSPGPCIDGVFNQFLERGSGSFDDLAGSYAIDQMFGKTADLRHLPHASVTMPQIRGLRWKIPRSVNKNLAFSRRFR